MFFAATLAPSILTCLATAVIWLPIPQETAASEPRKESLTINITSGDYREADGAIVLSVVASNSTTKDAVITGAKLVHPSLSPGGELMLTYKNPGRSPRFKQFVVGAGKSEIFQVESEVDLADFYRDDLEARNLPEDQRSNARAGRLFLELHSIDGFGKSHQNFYRIGTVTVFHENSKYVRPLVITNGRSLDAFAADTLMPMMLEIMKTS